MTLGIQTETKLKIGNNIHHRRSFLRNGLHNMTQSEILKKKLKLEKLKLLKIKAIQFGSEIFMGSDFVLEKPAKTLSFKVTISKSCNPLN